MSSTLDIDLWLCPETPAADAQQEALWWRWLSAEERERHARFVRAEDRARFLRTRALLRSVLGSALQLEPQQVELQRDAHGKPRLPGAAPALHFNLSHTQGLAALALCRSHELGVDVECIMRELEVLPLAQRYFAAAETRALERCSDDSDAQRQLFFTQWTLKEAWVKAKGLGLRVPLDAFWFELPAAGSRAPVQLRCDDRLGDRPADWSLLVQRHGEHALALAVQNPAQLPLCVTQHDAGVLLNCL